MKVKHLLLGIALVALTASCGKKEAAVETTTDTAIETMAEEVVEAPVEEATAPVAAAPKATTPKATTPKDKPAPKVEEPKVDPCDKIVTDYESYASRLKSAQQRKGTGTEALKEYLELRKEATAREAAVRACADNATYKKRIGQAMIQVTRAI